MSDKSLSRRFDPKLVAGFLCGEFKRALNYNNMRVKDCGLTVEHIRELLSMLEDKEITAIVLHNLIEILVVEPQSPRQLVRKLGLERIADDFELEQFAQEAIKENPGAVVDFKQGKNESLNFLVGQVMRRTKGKADPKIIRKMICEYTMS